MADNSSVAPSPFEKLSLKFILDEIRDRKAVPNHEFCGTAEVPHEELIESAPIEAMVGESAEATSELVLPEGKKYFRIGEVSEIVGVEPYVLRYWESEFRSVRPVKTSAGHRVYARKDVETLFKIRVLLHVERFSIKGAKRALLKPSPTAQITTTNPRYASTLREMATDLKSLIQLAKQW